ncbi:ATP synthase subunit E [Stappia stellulata]|uniref:ATP synthase subunit E n=1 Tax=Stappia stellulata TaxID=71235 RepID=UPI00041386ED|nr:ATP synthase subunit E [Stappia stellulata]
MGSTSETGAGSPPGEGADVHSAGAGVQALIDRLRQEGVDRGEREANALLAAAREKADALIAEAEASAADIRDSARRDAHAERGATQDALKIAARDVVLSLRNEIAARIDKETSRLLREAFADESFLKRLVLALAGKVRADAGLDETAELEIVLPEKVVTFEELKADPETVTEGTLTHLVVSLAANVLRDGVTFSAGAGFEGIRIRLRDRDLEVDVTEEAIAPLLMKHLQPRFRAVMEGVVR